VDKAAQNRKRMRQIKARNRKVVEEWKLNQKKCCDCALKITPETAHRFDIDHVDPSQKRYKEHRTITNLQALIEELDKCVLRCAFCHRDRSLRLNHHMIKSTSVNDQPQIEWARLFDWPA